MIVLHVEEQYEHEPPITESHIWPFWEPVSHSSSSEVPFTASRPADCTVPSPQYGGAGSEALEEEVSSGTHLQSVPTHSGCESPQARFSSPQGDTGGGGHKRIVQAQLPLDCAVHSGPPVVPSSHTTEGASKGAPHCSAVHWWDVEEDEVGLHVHVPFVQTCSVPTAQSSGLGPHESAEAELDKQS